MAEPTPAMPKCSNATNSHRRAPSVKHGGMPIYKVHRAASQPPVARTNDKPRAEAEFILIMPGCEGRKAAKRIKMKK